jgi:hypothetical protein
MAASRFSLAVSELLFTLLLSVFAAVLLLGSGAGLQFACLYGHRVITSRSLPL